MITLGQIRGQERVVDFLTRAIASDRVPHAYLFTGPSGCGKHSTAVALAIALNCQDQPGKGCGQCSICERIYAGNHPDVVTLERQGASQTIPIDVIRKQVIPAMGLPPHEAAARFFLIEEATSLLGPAANALLKTLEEPPDRSHFVLATSSIGELLPTIKSRCQRVIFQPLAAEVRAEIDDGSSGEIAEQVDRLEAALLTGAKTRADVLQIAAEIAKDRDVVKTAVRMLAQRLHRRATAAASAGHLDKARRLGLASTQALECERAMSEHNAHGLLAMDGLLTRLGRQELWT